MYLHFSFALDKTKTARRFDLPVATAPENRYNISPGQEALIIEQAATRTLLQRQWGKLLPESTPHVRKAEVLSMNTILSRNVYKNLLAGQRCMVPADGFYFWKKFSRKSAVPQRVTLKWNLPFALAGIWSDWLDESSGEVFRRFALLTVPSNALIKNFEPQMPAILPIESETPWLDHELTDIEALKKLTPPYPADKMKMFPVSARLSEPDFNSPELYQPAPQATDQLGNYILFQ
jgi:putative SOS response-associated peptidase YedK